MQVVLFIVAVISVWLLSVSVITFWLLKFFRRLTNKVADGNLINILEKIITEEKENTKSISEIRKNLQNFEEEGTKHVQKVGLIRFNPFRELGGDHSFSLALLDGKNTGVVITGLHTRDRTRIYVKDIKKGNAKIELSSEEKKALNLAFKNSKV